MSDEILAAIIFTRIDDIAQNLSVDAKGKQKMYQCGDQKVYHLK